AGTTTPATSARRARAATLRTRGGPTTRLNPPSSRSPPSRLRARACRTSPFGLESVLIEHDAVVEAAVVPSPDELRLAVPKAYVVLAEGWAPDEATAKASFAHWRED